jgi:hypothetical protein
MSQDPIHAQRTRHIDLRVLHLKELNRRQIVRLVPVTSANQHADFLTKALPHQILRRHHLYVCGYPDED